MIKELMKDCPTCELIRSGGMFEGGVCVIHDQIEVKHTGKFFKGYAPQFYFRTKVQRNERNPLAGIKIYVN